MSNLPGKNWGVDIGGTTTILGYLDTEDFITVSTLPTKPDAGPEELLERINLTVSNIDDSPVSLGAGIAGLIDRNAGVLVSSPNLAGWSSFPIRERLTKIFRCPVQIDNDCNVFAIRAINSGEIPSDGLWLLVTLGTGIGGSIISNGSILYGTGYAGEFGHMTIESFGRKCPCGSRGCWERYASSEALIRYFSKKESRTDNIDPRQIALLAGTNDDSALRAFKEFGKWIGVGLANLSHCFSPSGIIIAGGLVGGFRFFSEPARLEFCKRCPHEWNVNALSSNSDAGAEGAAIMGKTAIR